MSVAMDVLPMVSFETDLGWVSLSFQRQPTRLIQMVFGHKSRAAAERRLKQACPAAVIFEEDLPREVKDWRRLLEDYSVGRPASLESIPIDEDYLTPFGKKVIRACRRIPHGKTLSYGQLAKQAGRPGAARAVGSVMANNRVPLVVPCHRVLGAGGKLGGYSAPDGVAMKRRLLEMEGGWLF